MLGDGVVSPVRMRPDELEKQLRQHLRALRPAPRAELVHVLMLPNLERAERIGEYWGHPETQRLRELLIDAAGGEGGGSPRRPTGRPNLHQPTPEPTSSSMC